MLIKILNLGKKLQNHKHIDWMITSTIASFIGGLDIYFLLYMTNNTNHTGFNLGAIGIITFFGMLIVSSLHGINNKASKGTFRQAVASTVIVVYIIAFSLITFGNSETNNSVSPTTEIDDKTVLGYFSNIVIVVIAFYFGTKGVKEFLPILKGNQKPNDRIHRSGSPLRRRLL